MPNVAAPQAPQNQPTESPMMGLFLDRPAHMIDPKGFSACNNVRIELGRVRSDLIGWTLSNYLNLGKPVLYLDSFTNVNGQTVQIAVTPTDILKLNTGGAGHNYITPTLSPGNVNVTNGSALVTVGSQDGSGIWLNDFQVWARVATVAASVGATTLTTPALAGNDLKFFPYLTAGFPIFDVSNPLTIPRGTYITYVYWNSVASTVTFGLSQPLQAATTTDTIQVGNGLSMRPNVRAGDQIAFGTTNPGVTGPSSLTWYTIQSVASGQLTLTTPYLGTNLTNAQYVIRQCLTDITDGAPLPTLPSSSSDSYLQASGFGGNPGNFTTPPANVPTQGGDMWFFTNRIDPIVVYYDNTGTCQYSRTIPFFAGCLKSYKGLMVFGNLVQAVNQGSPQAAGFNLPTSIASSDNGFPQQMNTGVAFEGIATGGPFKIGRIAILGSVLLLYSTGNWSGGYTNSSNMSGAVTSASFVGYPTIWTFSDIIQTRGPVAGNAVAVFPDRHQFLSIDAEYRYNGLFIQVMNDQVWRTVLKTFDTTHPNSCFAMVVPTFGDLLWVVPLTADPVNQLSASTAFVEHYMEQANSYLFKPYTQRDFPFLSASAYQLNSAQPIYFAGDANGNIWQLYVSNLQNGVAPLCTATWAARKIGNGRSRVLVTRVYPEIEYQTSPPGNVTVTLRLQDATAGPTVITDAQTFNPSYPGGLRFTDHFRRGRVAAVAISDQAGVGWVCDGYDWDFVDGGMR